MALPPNNGSAQVMSFKKVRTQSMRELIATGVLNELEFGLLKGSSKSNSSRSANDRLLGWGVEEKGVLLNMEVEQLKVVQGDMELEVEVRCLCYSRGVTADYLETHERFNMKQCVLVLGDLGKGAAPWSELVQPAVHLHRKEFNIIWIDVPSFKSNPQKWLRYGADILRGLLRFFCIKQVSVMARGVGGAVFLEALSKAPDLFARTHLVYNMDMPKGKSTRLPIFELEEVLRKRELQLWFAFKDDESYDRFVDGTPMKAYDAIQKLQARLLGERQRGKRTLTYDEVLITENLNSNPLLQHAQDLKMSIYTILVFSTAFLVSIAFFLEVAPGTRQDGMDNGLVGDFRKSGASQAVTGGEGEDEAPLAVRRTRIGHLHGLTDRRQKAFGNKKRLDQVSRALTEMRPALPDLQNGQYAGFQNELERRLGIGGEGSDGGSNSGSRSGSRAGSRAGLSRGSSRTGTKDGDAALALPALQSSASAPSLQALANEPANSDSEDEEGGLLGPTTEGQQPWQNYRRMWSQMHAGKVPSAYTHPMKQI